MVKNMYLFITNKLILLYYISDKGSNTNSTAVVFIYTMYTMNGYHKRRLLCISRLLKYHQDYVHCLIYIASVSKRQR